MKGNRTNHLNWCSPDPPSQFGELCTQHAIIGLILSTSVSLTNNDDLSRIPSTSVNCHIIFIMLWLSVLNTHLPQLMLIIHIIWNGKNINSYDPCINVPILNLNLISLKNIVAADKETLHTMHGQFSLIKTKNRAIITSQSTFNNKINKKSIYPSQFLIASEHLEFFNNQDFDN